MSLQGLSFTAAQTALEAVLPNGTNRYVGLLTTIPSARDGTGLVEVSAGGYARVAHSAWLNAASGSDQVRRNDGTITFAAFTEDQEDVVGWGIWTAVSGGTLLAFGPLVNGSDVETAVDFVVGDEPRFAAQELEVKLGVTT